MLLLSCLPFDSSFISTQFFYFNSNFCLSSGDIYLSLGISSSLVSELFCGEVFETLVILSAILFPIQSPVASAIF